MKKIIIVTFQNAYNYGAILQCFALQKTLEKVSEYNVEVLNYDNIKISNMYRVFYKPFGKLKLLKYIKSFFKGIFYLKQTLPRNISFKKFINENINLTSLMSKEEILNYKFNKNYIFVCGSDQIWNTSITGGIDSIYLLNFGKGIKKISYAASIGNSSLEEDFKPIFKKNLDNFDYISVRENTAKNILKDITKKDVNVVLDPTLLLKKDEWNKYLSSSKFDYSNYIFVYMPNQECIDLANSLSNITNKKICYIDQKNIFSKKHINVRGANPFDFVNCIKNADYIITTSFHATIFSIVFNKKFWVVPPKKVGSRITDLLNMLNLSDRMVSSLNDYFLDNYDNEINYKNVIKKLDVEREKSINWIGKSL